MSTFSDMIAGIKKNRIAVQNKIAEISGKDPDSIPGAEKEKPVDVPKGDAEVNDGSMGPKSSRSTEGHGDDRPITAGDLFEAGESVVNPEEKPLTTADANAKEAGAKVDVNDILGLIHAHQEAEKKAAAEPAKTTEPAKPAEPAKKEATAEPAKKEAASEPAKKAEPAKPADGEKNATLNLELTRDVLAKIACLILADKEGAEIGERILAREAGKEKAAEINDYIAGQEQAAREYAAGQQAAVAALTKRAQDLGAADADAAIAAMAAESPEAAPAPAPAPEPAPEPAGDEMLPEDAVAQVLLSQLAEGKLTESDLGAIVAELAADEPEVAKELGIDLGVGGGEGGEGGEGGVPAGAEGGTEPAAGEAEPDDGSKAASAKAVKAASPKILKQAALVAKVAQAAKLLTAHLRK